MTGIQLIAGLANPGEKYAKTRHNAGAWWLENIANALHAKFTFEKKFHGEYAKLTAPSPCHLLIPHTFMNLSGQSISACLRYLKLEPQQLLVAHDDLDLPVGTVRLKFSGGDGGHNGLKDIIRHLNSKDFYRLRIGIGKPDKDKHAVVDYVLHPPTSHERKQIDAELTRALTFLPDFLNGNYAHIMQSLHTEINSK